MDAIIATMAKMAPIDAAHYTWLYVDMHRLRKYSVGELQNKLLQHGDYAAPMRTEDVRQPFNNMAVVMSAGKQTNGEETLVVVTVNSNEGEMQEAVLHTRTPPPNDKIMTLYFKPDIDVVRRLKAQGAPVENPLTPAEKMSLVAFEKGVPAKMRESLRQYFLPMLRLALCYIAAASDGLLAGEQVSFHKPKSVGNNAKRIRKGKAPLYEWTTVHLERKPPELPSAPKGGTHASPRLHQRRGHWVTSKLGKRFWRSESVVGKPENGMIFHDYKDGGAHA